MLKDSGGLVHACGCNDSNYLCEAGWMMQILVLGKWRQEHQEFKTSLSYIMNLRPILPTGDLPPKPIKRAEGMAQWEVLAPGARGPEFAFPHPTKAERVGSSRVAVLRWEVETE